MGIKETLEILELSEEFINFKEKNPDAEMCAGFFIIDFFGNDNKRSIDFKVGDKIFTCSLRDDDSIKIQEDKLVEVEGTKFPELQTINPNIKVDAEDAIGIAKTRTLDEGIAAKYNKAISVLQKHEGKQVWNITAMLDGLIILHILVNADSGEIIKFERKSMMDLIKKK
ncbi:PepSY domain-containing protein [Candidatus Pacearchaeota archaeon]|nr:PepSY domain-containing protein [Candidatus Pacearchaeota archaeon]